MFGFRRDEVTQDQKQLHNKKLYNYILPYSLCLLVLRSILDRVPKMDKNWTLALFLVSVLRKGLKIGVYLGHHIF
jgi:hypothetical protein